MSPPGLYATCAASAPDRNSTGSKSGLQRLSCDEPNLDIKPVTGSPPWLRLRVGDWRVLYRRAGDRILVARIIHRSELQQAIRTLE